MFKIGDKVTLKGDFTLGVGIIVEPPEHFCLTNEEVDVQWPTTRRFELKKDLSIVLDIDFVAPCPVCGGTPIVHRASMGIKLFDGYLVSCGGDLEKGWHDLRADLNHWNIMFKAEIDNPLVKFVNAKTEIVTS